MTEFTPHHAAISVRNLEQALRFYEYFGLKVTATWYAKDDSLTIVHMSMPGGFVLELFHYTKNTDSAPLKPGVGNDLEDIGVKHFGFHVSDLASVRDRMLADGFQGLTPLTHGRTQVDYFFVPDPDGNWVEVVEDNRVLSTETPLTIRGQ